MTKVISLSDDAYNGLKALKHRNESFSKVIRRIIIKERKRTIMDFAGMWKDNKEMDIIFKKVLKDRKKFKTRKL